MAELPQGTVTFLFTDIEGSTPLLKRLGDRYRDVLDAHRRILRDAAEARDGREVDTQGDSFFFAFSRANAALAAAVVAQRALSEHVWPDGAEVRVRMGLHTAEPEVGEERYVGLGVHRAARIGAAAHGGQVLLSSSTRPLVDDEVGGVSVRELGLYRLKDFDQPERLYQLDIDGLRSKFPPLRAEAAPPHRRRLLLLGAAVLVACLAAAAVFALTGGGGSDVEVGATSLAVIDPKSNTVVDAIDLGFKTDMLAAGEGYVWAVDRTGGTLSRIDPRTHEVRRFGITTGAGDVPFGIAAGEGAVWVAVVRGQQQVLREFGPEIGELRETISYGGHAGDVYSFLLRPLAVGGGAIWAIDSSGGNLWRIDPRSTTARKFASGLDALALAIGRDAVWVAGSTGVTKLDAVSGLELGSAPVGAQTFTERVSIALGRDAVWYAASSSRRLSKLDPRLVETRETFLVGRGASGVAVDGRTVWVTNSRDGTVSRIDPGTSPETIPVGEAPSDVAAAYGAIWVAPGAPRS